MLSAYKNAIGVLTKMSESITTGSSRMPTSGELVQLQQLELLSKTIVNPEADPAHMLLLKKLWFSFYPDEKTARALLNDTRNHGEEALGKEQALSNDASFSVDHSLWKRVGFQRTCPVSDIRGGGELSLQCLVFFATRYPQQCQFMSDRQRLRRRNRGMQKGYPWAAAGINVSRMVAECVELTGPMGSKGKYENSRQSQNYWDMLCFGCCKEVTQIAPETAVISFAEIFCVAFQLVDAMFVDVDAGYMDFNEILAKCKDKLKHAFSQKGVNTVGKLRKFLMLEDPDEIYPGHERHTANTHHGSSSNQNSCEIRTLPSSSSLPPPDSSSAFASLAADCQHMAEWQAVCECMKKDAEKRLGLTSANSVAHAPCISANAQGPIPPSYDPTRAKTRRNKHSGVVSSAPDDPSGVDSFWAEFGLEEPGAMKVASISVAL
jgi:hypothetical protein